MWLLTACRILLHLTEGGGANSLCFLKMCVSGLFQSPRKPPHGVLTSNVDNNAIDNNNDDFADTDDNGIAAGGRVRPAAQGSTLGPQDHRQPAEDVRPPRHPHQQVRQAHAGRLRALHPLLRLHQREDNGETSI